MNVREIDDAIARVQEAERGLRLIGDTSKLQETRTLIDDLLRIRFELTREGVKR